MTGVTAGFVVDLAYQLATGSTDLVTTSRADRYGVAGLLQHLAEGADRIGARTLVVGAIEGIERNEVYFARHITEQFRQFPGMLAMIVDSVDQDVLNGGNAAITQ
jgi:hypothetical protein